MESKFNKITKQHVLRAIDLINTEEIKLNPSTGYDVIIEGKAYPPKEIIRISYRIATGLDIGIIYGGEQVNSPLRDLGFEIRRKIYVWKLGCNWGHGAPSFYEFIKQENIVIGTSKFYYGVGDLILITEGFTVYAIAKVLSAPLSVLQNKGFREDFKRNKIDYDDWVNYARAEWYELKETEVFNYRLQQGMCKVNSSQIIERAINIWENRNQESKEYNFYSENDNRNSKDAWQYPAFVLIRDAWDDFGFKTCFDLFYYKTSKEKTRIGQVKILKRDSQVTDLPKQFESLNSSYASLGQTLEYYRRLKSQFPEHYRQVLKSLNDCAFYDNIKIEFEFEDAFTVSLLRSSEALLTLNNAAKIIGGDNYNPESFEFEFSYLIKGALEAHVVTFQFDKDKDLSNRFFGIIGKNGTGKTRYLAQLVNKLVDNESEGRFNEQRPQFSKIISASFSYFDKFKIPERRDISYEFIGVRNSTGLLNEKQLTDILWSAYQGIVFDRNKKALWMRCIQNALEVEYFDFDLEELDNLSTKREFVDQVEEIFSSGQKIIFQFITRLLATIEFQSLIVFDEPETHLHPNIAGRLLKAIKNVLDEYTSYCILATHSPIIVQEIPSRFIRIFDRQESMPLIYPPSIECFGENLSTISNSIFHVDEEKELYKIQLDELIRKFSITEINEIFNKRLSLNASLYVQAKAKKI